MGSNRRGGGPRRGRPPALTVERAARAIAHPTRAALLALMEEAGECSPQRAGAQLGEPLGRVSYHFRELEKLGAIRMVRVAPVRGALEHFYVATHRITVTAEPLRREELVA